MNEQPAGWSDATTSDQPDDGAEAEATGHPTVEPDGSESAASVDPPTPREDGPTPPVPATEPATRRSTGGDLWSGLREIIETLVLAALFFFALRAVVQNFRVEGSSMFPTFADGQYVLVNKAVYAHITPSSLPSWLPLAGSSPPRFLFHPPQRGDVIVFHPPPPNDPSRDFIKRVIGVPGDNVAVRDGRIYLNGSPLSESYIHQPTLPLSSRYSNVNLGTDQYFVLGDNRGNSSDSRAWGTINADAIVGRTWLVYWPLSAWKLAPNVPLSAPAPAAAP